VGVRAARRLSACALAEFTPHCGPYKKSDSAQSTLDDSTRRREIDGFKPDVFLSIRRNGGTEISTGQLVDVIYDVRLVDIQSKRIVWRAAVTFYRGGTIIPSTDRGAALAVDITNKMKEDHIFRTCEVIKAKS
jgi:hypothetical protein